MPAGIFAAYAGARDEYVYIYSHDNDSAYEPADGVVLARVPKTHIKQRRAVYFSEAWDVGPGETASFPTKWMSTDGTSAHLVFSGDDHFTVRRADLRLAR